MVKYYTDLAGNIIKVEQINGEYTIRDITGMNKTPPVITDTYVHIIKKATEEGLQEDALHNFLYEITNPPYIYKPTPINILKIIDNLPEYTPQRNVFLAIIQNRYVKLIGPSYIKINKSYTYHPYSKRYYYTGQIMITLTKEDLTKIMTYPVCIFTTISKTKAIKLLMED